MVSDSIWREMVLIGLAILLHGVCKGLEVAILAAQKSRLQQWKETDRRGSSTAVLIGETPERFLTTIQILMTGLGIFTAALAGVVAVRDVAPWIVAQWTWPGIVFWSVPLAFALVISILTFMLLIVGQWVPQVLVQQYPEHVLCWVARPLVTLTRIGSVIRIPFTATLTAVLWLLRQQRLPESMSATVITEEDVTTMVREGAERGIFEEVEHELIEGVFEFTDTAAREIMIPRVLIQALEVSTPPEEVIHKMGDNGHSRAPVYRGDLDHVVGVLYFKELLRAISEGRSWTLRSLLHPPLFVPETVQISRLLRTLQQRRLNMAMVVDEHGGVAGLITVEDLLEQLVGEIADEDEPDPDAQIVQLPDGSLVIQGGMPLWDLRERFDLPVEESSDYQTLAGLMLARLGRVPQGGETIIEHGYRLTVVDMDGPRIVRVKVEQYTPEETGERVVDMPFKETERQANIEGEA
ncbi:MAG: hemolysin family protein [Candidatus Tectomicrobia bacterium]